MLMQAPVKTVRVSRESHPSPYLSILKTSILFSKATITYHYKPHYPHLCLNRQLSARTKATALSKLSSSSPPSPTPSYEIMKVEGAKGAMPPSLQLASGSWAEKPACTWADYLRLREVLQLSKASAEGGARSKHGRNSPFEIRHFETPTAPTYTPPPGDAEAFDSSH